MDRRGSVLLACTLASCGGDVDVPIDDESGSGSDAGTKAIESSSTFANDATTDAAGTEAAGTDAAGTDAGTSSDTSGASSGAFESSGGSLPDDCGNGVLDRGEACDPRLPGHADICTEVCSCVLSGLSWEATPLGMDAVVGKGRDIATTPAGTFVFVGVETLMGTGLRAAFARELDADGVELWNPGWLAPGPDSQATDVVVAGDGTVVIAGNWLLEATEYDGCGGWFAAAFAPDGEPAWTIAEPESCLYTRGMAVRNDGAFAIAGSYSSFFSVADLKLVTSDGEIAWSFTASDAIDSGFSDVAVLEDDTVVVIASELVWETDDSSQHLRAFAPDGSPSWSFEISDDPSLAHANAMASAPDGSLRLAGARAAEGSASHTWIVAVDPPVTALWHHESPSPESYASAIAIRQDGTAIVSGARNVQGNWQGQVIHMSADGLGTCEIMLDESSGSPAAVAAAASGPVLLAGEVGEGPWQPWVARVAL